MAEMPRLTGAGLVVEWKSTLIACSCGPRVISPRPACRPAGQSSSSRAGTSGLGAWSEVRRRCLARLPCARVQGRAGRRLLEWRLGPPRRLAMRSAVSRRKVVGARQQQRQREGEECREQRHGEHLADPPPEKGEGGDKRPVRAPAQGQPSRLHGAQGAWPTRAGEQPPRGHDSAQPPDSEAPGRQTPLSLSLSL